MFSIQIPYYNQLLTLKWEQKELLGDLINRQRKLTGNTLAAFYQKKLNWFNEIGLYDNLPGNSKILDIGSGVGIIDLLAYQILDHSKFYLLDKDELRYGKKDYYGEVGVHGFYNDKECTLDAIQTSGLNKEDFYFLTPDDAWTEQFDLITSFGSWCWHYPLSAYWDKVCQHLKPGGKLYLEVSNNALQVDTDLIDKVSKFTNCKPTVYACNNRHVEDENLIWINGCYGYSCIWTNNTGV